MDRHDHEPLAKRFPKHLKLRPAAQALDDDVLSVDSRQRAFRPNAKSVDLPVRLGHPAYCGIRDGKAPTPSFPAHHVAHPDHREPEVFRYNEDFFFSASGHARDADYAHEVRGIGGLT